MQNQESKNRSLSVVVSEEDILDAGYGLTGNPIARALTRATQSRWRVWDGRIAQKMNDPEQVFYLPKEVSNAWDAHEDLSKLPSFTFQFEMGEGDDSKFVA